jgi:hypothetical protein
MFRCEFLKIRMREKLPKSASAHITHSARACEIYKNISHTARKITRAQITRHTHSLSHTRSDSHTRHQSSQSVNETHTSSVER